MRQGNMAPVLDPSLDPDEQQEWAQVFQTTTGSWYFALTTGMYSLNDILNIQYTADYWVNLTALGDNASDAQAYWTYDPDTNFFSNPGIDQPVSDALTNLINDLVALRAASDAAQPLGFEQGLTQAFNLARAQGVDPDYLGLIQNILWPMLETETGVSPQ